MENTIKAYYDFESNRIYDSSINVLEEYIKNNYSMDIADYGYKNSIIEKIYLSFPNNLVYYDTLTGIKNRAYYERVIKNKYLNYDCVIVYCDIDNLKESNDKYGHSYGNMVVKSVTDSMSMISGLIDICRLHGDEVLAIVQIDKFEIQELYKIKNISFGFYAKLKGEEVSFAVHEADRHMYEQKKAKKGVFCGNRAM